MAALFDFAIATDFAKTQEQLDLLQTRVGDLSEFHREVGAYLVNSIRNRIYTTKTAPDGTKWAKNSELTVALKGGSSVLYQSGELVSSIRFSTDPRGVSISAPVPYASYVQNGRSKTRGRYRSDNAVPDRKFMGISDANRARIAKMLRAHISKNLIEESPVGVGTIGLRRSAF